MDQLLKPPRDGADALAGRALSIRHVLRLDGFGGFVTGVIFAFVLPRFGSAIPFSDETFLGLALVGFAYACCSFVASRLEPTSAWQWLRIMVVANLAYCIGISTFVACVISAMHPLAVVYFALEVLAILSLVALEIWTLRRSARAP